MRLRRALSLPRPTKGIRSLARNETVSPCTTPPPNLFDIRQGLRREFQLATPRDVSLSQPRDNLFPRSWEFPMIRSPFPFSGPRMADDTDVEKGNTLLLWIFLFLLIFRIFKRNPTFSIFERLSCFQNYLFIIFLFYTYISCCFVRERICIIIRCFPCRCIVRATNQ